jgi:NADH-quinone oxidoreductase subunit L
VVIPTNLVWLIFLLPFFAFLVNALLIRPFFSRYHKVAGYVTIAAIAGSLLLGLWLLRSVMGAPDHRIDVPDVEWAVIGNVSISIGLLVDSLTAVMVVVVALVSLMVQVYSQGYMAVKKDDHEFSPKGYIRYFAFMALFTGSMLGLVMARSLLFLYLFWEGVGLCSYFLIGFWFHRPSAARAALKAFLVTRLGDLGFLLAIIFLYLKAGTFDIEGLHALVVAGTLGGAVLTWAALGILAGAVGKSAQFPLHVWLPDAMEGPTPVSALIHAATMVAAGAFLVARTFPLFESSPQALTAVAAIGGFTALFAATMGLVMNDIKRVIAYSTISQLGYMMLGLGTGGVAVGIFHLYNHAFFKALLFLGAGSVNHASGTFDMREMGGLRKYMPWTFATFLVAALSLAGIWPLSGFWSKDGILVAAFDQRPLLFYLALATVPLTAFYIFRVLFMTFGGAYRGQHKEHLHESPAVMLAPMAVLGLAAVFSGVVGIPGSIQSFLGHGEEKSFLEGLFGILREPLPWLSLVLSGLGIFTAWAMYSAKWLSLERVGRALRPLYVLFSRKYYFDELYENLFLGRGLLRGLFRGLEVVDRLGVDGVVNAVAGGSVRVGRVVRRVQTGELQLYGVGIALGLLVLFAALYFFG